MWSGSSPIDAMTPGWGQESDPCYLGGWRCSVCPVCPYNPAFTEAERNAAIAARTPPPPAAPAVSPEPGHDGHTHDVGPVRVWRCRTEGAGALKPTCTPDNPHDDRCSWVDAVPSPEPERRWECNKPGWMGACSPQSTHHNGFDWGCGWNAATPEPERDES